MIIHFPIRIVFSTLGRIADLCSLATGRVGVFMRRTAQKNLLCWKLLLEVTREKTNAAPSSGKRSLPYAWRANQTGRCSRR